MDKAGTLYERDFYAWALGQAEALRRLAETRSNLPLDFENLIDEVEALARTERAAVLSQLQRLIEHLLKLEFSSSASPRRGWRITVNNARAEIEDRITPTIRSGLEPEMAKLFRRARENAVLALLDHGERGSAELVKGCEPGHYRIEQLLDPSWLPANRHGLVDEPL